MRPAAAARTVAHGGWACRGAAATLCPGGFAGWVCWEVTCFLGVQDVTNHSSHSRPALKLPSLPRPSCATITVPCSSTFSALDAFLGVNGTVDVGVVATGCGTRLYAAV